MFVRRQLDWIKESQVFQRLRRGVPDEELRSPFEKATLPAYCIITLFLVGLFLAFRLTYFHLDSKGLLSPIVTFLSLLLGGIALRRYGHTRIAGSTEAIGIIGFFSLLTAFSLAMLCATNLPFADDLLIRADAALGFSWIALFHGIENMPRLLSLLTVIYKSIEWQPIFLATVLMILNRPRQLWTFVNAWIISLTITVAIFPFFPARAAINYHGLSAQDGIHSADFLVWMQGLRNGSIRSIDYSSITGIVTFPSFHASTAILFAWGFASVPNIRWIILIINLAMLFATIIIGGHYLVDIIGGVLIAALAIWLSTISAKRLS